jgi:hypothetical protein
MSQCYFLFPARPGEIISSSVLLGHSLSGANVDGSDFENQAAGMALAKHHPFPPQMHKSTNTSTTAICSTALQSTSYLIATASVIDRYVANSVTRFRHLSLAIIRLTTESAELAVLLSEAIVFRI